MKVKKEKLARLLDENGMTAAEFAREIGADASEVKKLLNGEAVCQRTAERFINYLGAGLAQGIIDWKALGKKNPLACEAEAERADKGDRGTV
jgi:transcriptional regulator with XRE-family HTH domain